MTKEEKIEFARSRGWEDLWSLNNWIRPEWRKEPGNIDTRGYTLDSVVEHEINKDETKRLNSLPFNEMWKEIYGK